MAAREELTTLISYVLGDKNRQLLITSGLEAVPKERRIAALRGLQDLGWIGHSGYADFEDSYSLTKDGRRIASERPHMLSLEDCARDRIDALRAVDGESNGEMKEGLKKLVSIECDHGNWDSALMYAYQLRKAAEKSKDAGLEAFALFHQGKIEATQNKWDEALESYLDSNEKFMEMGDRKGVAETNRAIGVVYAIKGDHASARRCFEMSLTLAKTIRDKALEAKAEGNLANIYDLEGKFEESEKSHKKCLDYFLEVGDLQGASKTSNNLGVLSMSKDNFQVAGEYFENTIATGRLLKSPQIVGAALVNAAFCYARTKDLHRAITYNDEAVSIFKEPNDLNMLALAYRNYGCVELAGSNHEAAFNWFEKSIRAAKASGVEDTFAACCCEYGMALIHSVTDVKLAKKLLKKAAMVYRDIGNIERAKIVETRLAAA